MAQGVLKQLEMRYAVLADRDELAIDHGVRLHALECSRDFHVGVTDDLPVAAVERDVSAPDFRNHTKIIEFVLKYPIGIVERRVCKRGQHGLQAKRQGRLSGHGLGSL
jgi:hypothetical protein